MGQTKIGISLPFLPIHTASGGWQKSSTLFLSVLSIKSLNLCNLKNFQIYGISGFFHPTYRKIASSNTSHLEAYMLFQIAYEGDLRCYVLWPFDKKLIFQLVTRISTRNSTVNKITYQIMFSYFLLLCVCLRSKI